MLPAILIITGAALLVAGHRITGKRRSGARFYTGSVTTTAGALLIATPFINLLMT